MVRKIFKLCFAGRGSSQIARDLEKENILTNRHTPGCAVNFITTTVSYKGYKTIYNSIEEQQIHSQYAGADCFGGTV